MLTKYSLRAVIKNILDESRSDSKKILQQPEPQPKRFRLNAIKQFARTIIDVEDQLNFVKKQLIDISENHHSKHVKADAVNVLAALESFKRARKNLSIQLMQLLMKVSKF
jgi:hypothetical protein